MDLADEQRQVFARNGGAVAAILTTGLAAMRFVGDAHDPVWVILAVTAGAFALLAAFSPRFRFRLAFPLVGLVGVTAMALVTEGLASEATAWLPLVPFVASVVGGPRGSIAALALAMVAVAVLLGHEVVVAREPMARLALRAAGIGGAVVFSFVLAVIFRRERENAIRRFKSLADALPDIVFTWDLQRRRMTYLSPAGIAALGHVDSVDADALARQIAPHEDFTALAGGFAALKIGEEGSGHHRLFAHDGKEHQFESRYRRLSATEVLGTARDITDAEKIRSELKTSILRLNAVVENLNDGVAITDESGTILSINDPLRDIFGLVDPVERLVGRDAWAVIGAAPIKAADPVAFRKRILELGRLRHPVVHEEVEMADGRVFDRAFIPLDFDGNANGHLWSYHDITVRVNEHRSTRQLVETDSLTRIYSRQGFYSKCRESMIRRNQFYLLFIDLDGFKVVNDTLGHKGGDDVLVEVADRLRTTVRAGDAVGRLGGDEFAVLLEGVQEAAIAARVSAAILESLARPVATCGVTAKIGCSIGVAAWPRSAELIAVADSAMYEAKTAGKNCFRHAPEPQPDAAGA